jgi:tetratricopeptide (TPR) repeat protein
LEENEMLPPWHRDPAVQRYKLLMKSRRSGFFDVEEFQVILDHFMFLLDIPEASEVLDKALSQHPGSQELMLRKADLALINGQAEECLRIINQLQVLHPTDTDILRLKAEALASIGHTYRAIEIYESISRSDREMNPVSTQMRLAQLSAEVKGPLDAIPYWQAAIEIEQEFSLAYSELEECFENADLLEEGMRYFSSLTDESPYNFLAWSSLGSCFRLADRFTEAIDAFGFAMVIDVDSNANKVQMAFCFYQLDRYEESLVLYSELHTSDPEDPSHLCCMAECLEQLEHLDLAEQKYSACLALDPEYADARLGLAIIRDIQGEEVNAIRHIETAVGLEPENSEYWLVFARLLSKNKQDKRCRLAFERCTQLNPEDLEGNLLFLDHLLGHEEYDYVLEKVQNALQLIGNTPELYLRAIKALHETQRRDECSALIELMVDTHEGSLELLRDYNPFMFEDAEVLSLIKNL